MTAPKYRQLVDAIRAQIASGALRPGDKLPSTADLRARYVIGNDTVRFAMALLANEKLIVTRHGDGRYVWPGPPDPFADGQRG